MNAPPAALRIPVRGTTFEALTAGPADGPLVLLLHGFPQDASAFTGVLPALADAGLRAVALTQRGFSVGNRSTDRRDYRQRALGADVLAVAEALGESRPHIVGHDLGAVVGWQLAARQPERVATLTAVSVPHPAAYVAALPRSLQLVRSAYIPLFLVPVLAEGLLGARDGLLLRRALRTSGLDAATADRYVARLLPDGGLRAALTWYRSVNLRGMARTPPVRVPTSYAWSDRDTALDRAGAERTGDHVDGPYRFAVLPGASHWIPEHHPAWLAEVIIERVTAS